MSQEKRQKQAEHIVLRFPERRRPRRVGSIFADARADALRARFGEVSKAAMTGSADTPLKKLLKRF